MAHLKLCILTIFCIGSILGSKKCNLSDNECMKRGSMAAYPLFIKGIDNLVDPSDPLVLDSINADSETLMYKLQNAEFTGLKDCVITTLLLRESDKTFQYEVECPHVELNADYTMSGHLGDIAVEGAGPVKMTADKYELKFNGTYDKIIDKDNKDHVTIKSYNLDIDAKGKVEYEFKTLKGDSDAIHKYLNQNWKNEALQAPIHTFIKLMIEHLNKFLELIPTDEVFSDLS